MTGGDKMDELMQKLQSVLNDEESMNQIRQLASMFGGENNDNNSSDTQQPPSSSQNNNTADTASAAPNINMNDISKLLASLGGDSSQPSSNAQTNVNQNQPNMITSPSNQQGSDLPFDIGKIMTLGSIISNASKADKNTELLLALKPHLKEEKQEKVDKVIKIFKLISIWPAIKESGLLGGDLFGIL